MNQHTHRHPATARDAVERRFARGIAAALDRSLLEPPPGVGERLRFAREAALERARARQASPASAHPVALGAGGAAVLGFARSAWWGRAASVLPVIALVAGLLFIVERQQDEQIAVAADIDSQLLGDDLPLNAYRDPGFLEFLKAPPGERMTVRAPIAGSRRPARAAVALALAWTLAGLAAVPCSAQASGNRAIPVADSGARWQALSADQREILAPLRAEWPRMDAERRLKWLAIAGRYRSLSPAERERISSRMQEWVRLSPQDRGSARLSYEEAKQVPLSERQARWEKYLALPPEEKQRFEAEAAARREAALRAARAGRPEPGPVTTAGGLRPKVNATPARPAPGAVPLPVAPTTVRAGQGATTRPIGQTPAPPAHQQAGMPKIATTPEFVNNATLLPRRGPQAAAVAPSPATGGQAAPSAAARKGAAPSSAPQ